VTHYLSADDLCVLNEVVGGPGRHGADMPGIEAAAHRPQAGFGGQQKFPTIWLKAGALLHGLCSTQFFIDGNKRTAWTAVDVFLTKNGFKLPHMPTVEAEAFVLAVARDLFTNDDEPERTVEMAAEWFQSKWELRRRGVSSHPKLEYAFLCRGGEFRDGSFTAINGGLTAFSSVGELNFPFPAELCLIGRVHWAPDDMGRDHLITGRMIPIEPTSQKRVNRGRGESIPEIYVPPNAHAHPHLRGEPMPFIFVIPLNPIFLEVGRFRVVIDIDGEFAGEIPFELSSTAAPDYGLLTLS